MIRTDAIDAPRIELNIYVFHCWRRLVSLPLLPPPLSGWARSLIIRPRESLALYKSFNTLWATLSVSFVLFDISSYRSFLLQGSSSRDINIYAEYLCQNVFSDMSVLPLVFPSNISCFSRGSYKVYWIVLWIRTDPVSFRWVRIRNKSFRRRIRMKRPHVYCIFALKSENWSLLSVFFTWRLWLWYGKSFNEFSLYWA